jgi:aryl-alcohol dehydrogenase-like predicted oxidoreductase
MEYTEVARTRIRASRIGLGTWAIGGWIGDGSDDDSDDDVWVATIQNARDLRNNLIGTAPADG